MKSVNVNREERIYVAIMFFIIIFSFAYVFSGIAGVNVPRYYPETGIWLFEKTSDPSMGYYGKVALVLPVTLLLALASYIFYPAYSRRLSLKKEWFKGAAVISVMWAIFFYIGEEGHKWFLDKQSLTGGGFWNLELVFYTILIVLFIVLKDVFLWADKKMEES